MKIQQFRQTRAEELKSAARILESVFSGSINTSPIYVAAEALKNESPKLKDGSTNADFWGYEIIDFKIPVDTTRHTRPKGVIADKIELTLNMRLIANFKEWETLNDPLVDLNFNVVVRGLSNTGSHFLCFHIDKHDKSLASEEPHPTYHLQYTNNPNDSDDFNYGSTLCLDTPRIMHHPVDFILGIGMLTTNFFPMAFSSFQEDGYFVGLYKQYQEKILKPYSHTLANHWDFNKSDVIWKTSTDLCPFII